MKKLFSLTVAALFLSSGCSERSTAEPVKLSCEQMQKRVTDLNAKHGSWSDVPKESRAKLDALIKAEKCTIFGDDPFNSSSFKFSINKPTQ